MNEIRVSHTFEAAHRLPILPGKCVNLHGHSWRVTVTVAAPTLDENGLLVEFGPFKRALRAWVDEHLDHGAILGEADPLVDVLKAYGSKVYVVGYGWPTVETLAELLAARATDLLGGLQAAAGARVVRVDLQETSVNGASWVA